MHHFPAMQNEEIFTAKLVNGAFCRSWNGRKPKASRFKERKWSTPTTANVFKGSQERRQQRQLEDSRYQCRLLMRHVFIKLNWCAYAERKEERAGAKLLVTGGKQGASSKKCN